jgi:hypothetical protein
MSIVGNVPRDKVDPAEVELPASVIEREGAKIICSLKIEMKYQNI